VVRTTDADSFASRIAINQLTTLRTRTEQDLVEYREAGAQAIGLSCRKLYDLAPHQIARQLRDSGLKVSSLGWVGCFMGYHGHRLPEVMAEAKQAIKLAGRLGAPVVTVLSGPLAGHIQTHATRVLIESLGTLLPLADSCGVNLALLPMHPQFQKEWSFITHLDQVQTVLDKLKHPRMKVCFSTYHSCHEPGLFLRLPELVPHLGLVQISDRERAVSGMDARQMPGTGKLRLRDIVNTLESNGYRGWYELDVWCRQLWRQPTSTVLEQGLAAMHSLTPKARSTGSLPDNLTDTAEFTIPE
jgi:sugar phosphate isomerase/epimerase